MAPMNDRRVAMVTLGCPKNLTDSEVMAAVLGRSGYTLTDDLETAEAIVVNTCAFIGAARDEAWRVIGQAARLRKEGPCRALVVAGCLPQGFAGEIRRRAPEVDRLLGTGDVERVAETVTACLGAPATPSAGPEFGPPGYLPSPGVPRLVSTPSHWAYLKVAEGCNHRCAFCLIPSLRGPYRSRPPDEVITEARDLDRQGVRELVLVAQDTTAYGRDLGGRPLLAGLVESILRETGVAWVRTLYGYPSTLPEDFVALMAAEAGDPPLGRARLCRYLDLPMQHASDPILRAMRRPETGDYLLRLVERLRREVPGLTLRSTFIIGLPGETEKDFQVLLDFLLAARLEHAGFFGYSREQRTAAARLPGQVPAEEIESRLARIAQTQRAIVARRQRELTGSRLRVLVDGIRIARRRGVEQPVLECRSEADAPEIDGRVLVSEPAFAGRTAATGRPAPHRPAPGDFIEVEVTGFRAYDLLARPVVSPGVR